MNEQINTNQDQLTEQELLKNYVRHLERTVVRLRRRLDAAIRKIDADSEFQAQLYKELAEARKELRQRGEKRLEEE